MPSKNHFKEAGKSFRARASYYCSCQLGIQIVIKDACATSEIEETGNETFLFISKINSVTYLDFLHAIDNQYADSNKKVWAKTILWNSFKFKKRLFQDN